MATPEPENVPAVERDDDAHEAWLLEHGGVDFDDPYRHAPKGSQYSDD